MKYKLNNNLEIPSIAFGTWKFANDETTSEIIKNAINSGYRYIDTAKAYGNEEYIGKGIKKSKIAREDIIIGGKLWNEDKESKDTIIAACKETIKKLDCEYLDVYLMHWPASPAVHSDWRELNKQTWEAMKELYKNGLVKSIGVCNFKINQLEELMKNITIKPMINQIEYHPGFMQQDIVEYCQNQEILVEAWSPLGSGKLMKKEELKELANKYGKDTAQICIKWCLQNGVLPIPKTSNIERMKTNLEVEDFEISKEDMEYLRKLQYRSSGLDSETITLFG